MPRVVSFVRVQWPVIAITAAFTGLMLAFAGQYGLHRDEMYFIVAGRHPDFGYMDQPPLTPVLSALSSAVFGVSALGVRILPTIVYAAVVLLGVLQARQFGGGRLAQALTALGIAGSGWIAVAHLDSTETYDILGWTVFLVLAVRALRGGNSRLWLAAGIAAGIDLQNKNLILFLAVGFAAGILLARRWDVLRDRWVWIGAAAAFLIWLPNVVWQAQNGWPQLEMARVIADQSGAENRSQLILIQVLFAGPFLIPVFLAGLWWLLRSNDAAAWRPIGWAYPVVLLVLFATEGKSYYAGGLIPTIIAAGCVVAARWLERGRRWVRGIKATAYTIATAASVFLIVVLALPIVPAAQFPTSSEAKVNSDAVSEYGWPSFDAQVAAVVDTLSSADRRHAFILTGNYGEAGALQLLGSPDLPPVYSGQNSYWSWGPPDDARTIGIVIDGWDGAGAYFSPYLGACRLMAKIDLGFPSGISEEQGAGIWICRDRTLPWSEIWPLFKHLS